MKGNGDTFATVASDFYVHTKYVSVTTLEFTLAHTVPGVGISPESRFRDDHTCSPIDRTVPDGHGAASYPEVTPLDDSPSLRARQFDRTRAHAHARANVLHDDHERVGQRGLGRRTHAHTRRQRGSCGRLAGLAPS